MKQLSRDPFARITYLRESVHVSKYICPACTYCGNPGRRISNNETILYRYGYIEDGIYTRPEMERKLFCCKSCHDDYYR